MNTLNIIKKQIEKAAAMHDAQINLTRYRGIFASSTKVVTKCTAPLLSRYTYTQVINN